MALSVKNMLGGSSSAFFPSVFATGVSQSDDVRLFKIVDGEPVKEITNKKWVTKDNIPSAYQEVEYIESSGTQYIKTGVIPNATNFTAELRASTSGTRYLCGSQGSNPAYLCMINQLKATVGSTSVSNPNMSANVVHDIVLSTQSSTLHYIVDGNDVSQSISGSCSDLEWYIFGNNYQNALDGAGETAKIYYCKLSIGGVAQREFIPCYRKSDNVVGMYDTVSNTFYTNSGTGTFSKGADVLQSGFVFKLNELGMYRLNASNGTVTRSKDVLVDYPVEYILKISYIQYIYQNGTQVVPLRNETSYPFTFNSDSAVWSNNTGDRKGLLGTVDKIDLSLFTKLKADVMYSITTEHTYTYVGIGVASALMTSGPVSLAESRATKGTNVRTTLEVDISSINDDGFVYAHCNRYTGTVSFTIYSMWLE